MQWGAVSVAEEGPEFCVPQQVVVPGGPAGESGGPGRGRGRGDPQGAGGGVWWGRTPRTALSHPHRVLQERKSQFPPLSLVYTAPEMLVEALENHNVFVSFCYFTEHLTCVVLHSKHAFVPQEYFCQMLSVDLCQRSK